MWTSKLPFTQMARDDGGKFKIQPHVRVVDMDVND